ncbi:MAG: hypothetical protein LBU97_00515 [Alistipes sp.]|jgi:hypothetical protein|nr:hypothetical protein [Alistipes sp.]
MKELFGPEAGSFSLPDLRLRRHADGADVRGDGDDAGGLASRTRSNAAAMPGLEDALEPDWTKAEVWQNNRGVITEVPAALKKPVDYTVLVEKFGQRVSLTTQQPEVRILMVEPRDDREPYCLVATFLPDEGRGDQTAELKMGGKASGYSGVLIYSYSDGTPAFGWRYDKGEANRAIYFDDVAADHRDPDVRIAMGVSTGALTRSKDPNSPTRIEDVYCTACIIKHGLSQWVLEDLANLYGPDLMPYCNHLATDDGGGGGPPPTIIDPVTVTAPNASKIFKSTTLIISEWASLEGMVNKILADCMGGSLYNALYNSGKVLNITFNGDDDYFDGKGITIKNVDNGVLFHEMFHAYQYYIENNVSAYNNAIVNIEIEAYIAEYRFLKKQSEFASTWAERYEKGPFKKDIATFSDNFLSETGTLINQGEWFDRILNALIAQIKMSYAKRGKLAAFNEKRPMNDNFKNLQTLGKGC